MLNNHYHNISSQKNC